MQQLALRHFALALLDPQAVRVIFTVKTRGRWNRAAPGGFEPGDLHFADAEGRSRHCAWRMAQSGGRLIRRSGNVVTSDRRSAMASLKQTLYGGSLCYQNRSSLQPVCRRRYRHSHTCCRSVIPRAAFCELGLPSCNGDRRESKLQARQSYLPWRQF